MGAGALRRTAFASGGMGDFPLPQSPQSATDSAPATAPSRFSDQGFSIRRAGGLTISIAVHLLVAAVLLVHWTTSYRKAEEHSLSTFDVAPPMEPPVEEPTPEKVEPIPTPVTPRPTIKPVEPPKVILPSPNVIAAPPPQPVVKEVPPEAPPKPAPSPPSNAKPTWQGKVLARLNSYRRYPRDAHFARKQGVPYIRFTMDREGKVLSSRLERSSGVPSLDQEAVALPKRAQPLPKPPAEVEGDTIELVVPVEFFLR